MFNLAIDSKLRGCDVVHSRSKISLPADTLRTAQRSDRNRRRQDGQSDFELSEQTRQAVDDYLKLSNKRPGDFLFTGRGGAECSMTTRQYARLVSERIGSIWAGLKVAWDAFAPTHEGYPDLPSHRQSQGRPASA
jgi:hypothetical protein